MFEIQTFTAKADFVEDRIRLDAINEEGVTQSIFLTRRLMDRFLPILIKNVETEGRPGLPRDIDLAMTQQALRIDRENNPIPEVHAIEGARIWLCVTIHLESRPIGLLWTLTDDDANTASMTLVGASAREILDIFLLMYRELEWSLDVFPEWLTETQALSTHSPRVLN